jgi:hypothetical protein
MAKLTDEERAAMNGELAVLPDWGGMTMWRTIASGSLPSRRPPPPRALELAQHGDFVDWNGAKWMFVYRDPDTNEIWLAPMAGVKKRPEVVEPGEAPRPVMHGTVA